MSHVQLHNRDRLAQRQAEVKAGRDFGTQVDEKPTRTIGTMSDPIKTKNAGNETQPQSSSTQTPDVSREHKEDVMDFHPSTSYRSRDDRRSNGHYPSYRSTSLDHRNKHVSTSPIPEKHRDHSDYEQRRPRHRSHHHDDSGDPYISARDRFYPHSSLRGHRRVQSPSSPHGTPPPPTQYRSPSPFSRYRFPSPQRRRSRSPSPKKYSSTSASRHPPLSSSAQRRSRSSQRSISPTFFEHPTSSQRHRLPSPPFEYRSIIPDDRDESRSKGDSRRRKDRPKMVSAGTDTSLDDIKISPHRNHRSQSPSTGRCERSTSVERQHPSSSNHSNNYHRRSPTLSYQKLDSYPLKPSDYTKQEFIDENSRITTQDDKLPSTRKSYRLRPDPNDSYQNNYEENSSKYNEPSSSPLNRSLERSKEHIPKLYTDEHYRASSPSRSQRSNRDGYYLNGVPPEKYFRELPKGGSVSIPSTTVIQPETIPRSREQKKSFVPSIQNHFDNNRPTQQPPLHRAHERQTSSDGNSLLLNFATARIDHQTFPEEVAIPFDIRYVQEGDEEFSSKDSHIRSSTLKRDDLRARSNQIVLLPVLNSSRTHIFEKQSLRGQHFRQSQTNGNFYLATSPTFQQLNSSSNIDDIDHLTRSTLRSEVA